MEQIDVDIGEILFLLYPEDRRGVYAEEGEIAPGGARGVEWYRISRPLNLYKFGGVDGKWNVKHRKILVEVWKQVEQLYWSIPKNRRRIHKQRRNPTRL